MNTCPFLCRSEGIELPESKTETNYQRMLVSNVVDEELSRLAEYVPDSLVRRVFAIGSIDEVIDFIEERVRVGVKHVVVNRSHDSEEESAQAFCRKMIPYFRD